MSRLLADGIDFVVAVLILFGIVIGFAIARYLIGSAPFRLPRLSAAFSSIAFPITAVVYLTLGWTTTGKTVGKRLVGLRVVRQDGEALGNIRAALRAVMCVLIGFLSLLWSLFSKRNAAVHDLVFRTTVVYDWSDEVRTKAPEPAVVDIARP